MTFTKLIAAAALALTTTAASAQDADWTGFYGGFSYGLGELDASGAGEDDFINMGFHIGYLHDMGTLVVGAELEHAKVNFGGGGFAAGLSADTTRLKLKGGYDAGQLLPYAFIGVSDFDVGPFSDTMTTYGIGVDYQMTQSVRVGAEYVVDDSNGTFSSTGDEVKTDALNLRVSLNF